MLPGRPLSLQTMMGNVAPHVLSSGAVTFFCSYRRLQIAFLSGIRFYKPEKKTKGRLNNA